MTLILAGLIFSCKETSQSPLNQNDVSEATLTEQKQASIETRFRACEDLAQYHSKALDYLYTTQISVFRGLESNLDQREVNKAIETYLCQEDVMAGIENGLTKLSVATPTSRLRSQTLIDKNNVETLFEAFCLNANLEHLSDYIEGYIQGEAFRGASISEQNLLLMRIALYKDSFTYWQKEYPNWVNEQDEELRVLDGDEKDKGGDGWLSTIKTTLKKLGDLAMIDAQGSSVEAMVEAGVEGAGAGALGGAAAGSAVGGVGALPGAATGAVVGGLGGAAVKFIADAAKASSKAAREGDSDKKGAR